MTSTDPQTRPFDLEPKDLRKLLSNRGSFSTSYAMEILKLREPYATQKLIDMARAGWINYEGHKRQMDWWEIGQLGINFSMKKMLKRASISQGNIILEKAIAVARAYNAEDRATAITKISLFGSLVRGGDAKGTIGDIDLQVEYENRRSLTEAELEKRLDNDKIGAPGRWIYAYEPVYWGRARGLRAIRAISTRLSASEHDNIGEMGCEHRVVYAYDSATSQELEIDSTLIPADPKKQEKFNRPMDLANMPNIPEARAIPAFPKSTNPYVCVDAESSEYGWVRGMSLKDIGKWLREEPNDIQAALAVRGMNLPDPRSAILYDSPVETINQLMSDYSDYHFEIRMDKYSTGGGTRVSTHKGRKFGNATAEPKGVTCSNDPHLSAICAVVAEVGERWFARARKNLPNIDIHITFDLCPEYRLVLPEASGKIGASALAKSFNAKFDELYKATKTYRHRVYDYDLKYGHLIFKIYPKKQMEYRNYEERKAGIPVDDIHLMELANSFFHAIASGKDLNFSTFTLERRQTTEFFD